jgi:hypothetical protein
LTLILNLRTNKSEKYKKKAEESINASADKSFIIAGV